MKSSLLQLSVQNTWGHQLTEKLSFNQHVNNVSKSVFSFETKSVFSFETSPIALVLLTSNPRCMEYAVAA